MIGVGMSIPELAVRGAGVSLAAMVAAIVSAAGGALYDPSDLTSLYVARIGGTNAASGDVVGIMLDKSKMGGRSAAAFIAAQPEKITNGAFVADASWSKGTGWAISGGVASINAPGSNSNLSQDVGVPVGSWAQVTFDITLSAGQFSIFLGNSGSAGTTVGSSGSYTRILRNPGVGTLLYIQANATAVGSIDNVSVKEIPGFHALAPTDAARPLLTVASGLAYLVPDGVDDWMNVLPVLNLGEAWWHVGGWKADVTLKRPFALANTVDSIRETLTADRWEWFNSSAAFVALATGDPEITNVLTVQQTSTTNLQGRYNGVSGTALIPADDSAQTQGLAFFSSSNTGYGAGWAGRFYGGAFAPGAISDANRAIMERWGAQKAGVTL